MSEELVKRLRGEADIYGSYDVITQRMLTEAADAIEAQAAEIARLREALERLLTMPGDVDLSCNPHQAQVDALNARREVWNFARAALSEPMP
jgi:hypothetical protein